VPAVSTRTLVSIAAVALATMSAAGCGSEGSASDRESRGSAAVEACREHGGVSAFDDDAVICMDDTSQEARGSSAVAACKAHGGVSAFDDDIVICRDQTFHRAAGG
jgi:hypothetical protein